MIIDNYELFANFAVDQNEETMKHRHLFISIATLLLTLSTVKAAQPSPYTLEDSLLVEHLLRESKDKHLSVGQTMLHFARALKGIPYVGHTLDRTDDERMVINLHELDCTTYVESVLALTHCAQTGKNKFRDYVKTLQTIRYRQGKLSYENRLHYFEWWADDNAEKHLVEIVDTPRPPFLGAQKLKINFMSTNYQSYDMLRNHPERVRALKVLEDQTNSKCVRYIPKANIKNTPLLRQIVHDGDIIGIVTSKKNLDTTHLGIAVWHKDGLHMLHASSVHKKVIEDSTPLYLYLKKQPASLGIRIVRPL